MTELPSGAAHSCVPLLAISSNFNRSTLFQYEIQRGRASAFAQSQVVALYALALPFDALRISYRGWRNRQEAGARFIADSKLSRVSARRRLKELLLNGLL